MRKEVKVVNTDKIEAVTPYQCTVKGFKVRRVVTKRRVGSDKLMVGVIEIEPNCKGYSWAYSEEEGNDEVYYVLRGKVRLHYDGEYVDAKKGDAIFCPAGWQYQLDNRESEPAYLIYALTPPIE
jgi:mannose-6-phosphate isomerase-like protein (cupin superfamily)